MEKSFLFLRRIECLVRKMSSERLIDHRRTTYVAIKAIIGELKERNQGNTPMMENFERILDNSKWFAHIDHPGGSDVSYLMEIQTSIKKLNANRILKLLEEQTVLSVPASDSVSRSYPCQ